MAGAVSVSISYQVMSKTIDFSGFTTNYKLCLYLEVTPAFGTF